MNAVRLYKYLDVNGGKMMLRNSNLQFTNATRLNDPFECHPALFNFANAPVNEYNWPPADFLRDKGVNDLENLRNSAWICSLSKLHDSVPMWAYYGNHKGVCIGLNMEKVHNYLSRIICKLFPGALEMTVQYRDVIKKPDYFHGAEDYFRYLLSTKAKDWEHEQEVRLLLLNPIPAGTSNHPCFAPMGLPYKPKRKEVYDWKEVRAYPHLGSECYESLYLGLKMEDDKKAMIIKEARKCNPDIRIYQMTIDPDAFKLKEELINS